MTRKAYKFNPETLTYEPIQAPVRIRIYRISRKILIGFILACLFNVFFSLFFYTPKMARVIGENREMVMQFEMLQDKINAATRKVAEIKQRDNRVYRSLFATDTLDIPGVYLPYPDTKYASLANDYYTPMLTGAWKKLDALTRLLYLESRSLDELQILAGDKEKMADAIPAIWPIDKRNFGQRRIGAFGGRNHPILGRYLMHKGIDLGGRKGEPIYATGNGVVVPNGGGSGYGKQVLIDHGFGYKTRYAHLSKSLVVPGQRVVRGELIGEMGSTGRSTSSHLHYEVIYMGRHVDPINYFRRDMDDDEFERIIQNAQATTFEE